MREFRILDHLEEVVKTVTVNTVEEVQDVIYDLKEHHGFNMVFTYEEVLNNSNLDEQLKEAERKEKRYSRLEDSSNNIDDRLKYRKLKNRYSDLADKIYDMKEKSELEQIDIMIAKLKEVKASIKKRDKLSDKAFNMNHTTHRVSQMQKISTNLNWECMHLDKCKTDFARLFKGSVLDVSTDEKEYNPTGFHKYKG